MDFNEFNRSKWGWNLASVLAGICVIGFLILMVSAALKLYAV